MISALYLIVFFRCAHNLNVREKVYSRHLVTDENEGAVTYHTDDKSP